MSDLQPRLHDVLLDDPSVTRVVHRRAHGTAPRLLTRATGIATSVSVVVPTGGSSGQPFVDGVSAWNTAGLRTEVLVVESADDPGRAVLRDRLSRSGLSWRVLERPAGGRVATLAAVAEAVEQEFLVIPTSGDAPFEQVDPALCHMWTDGCDAAMLELRPTGEAQDVALEGASGARVLHRAGAAWSGGGQNRTADTGIMRPLLYQLSYAARYEPFVANSRPVRCRPKDAPDLSRMWRGRAHS